MKLMCSLAVSGLTVALIALALIPGASKPPSKIHRYIQNTFPCAFSSESATNKTTSGAICLKVTDAQIEQLSWVLENPVATPELDTRHQSEQPAQKIHKEIPRALARLYSLQLLRSGTREDYVQFVAPQKYKHQHKLPFDRFLKLAKSIQKLDDHAYEVLEAAAIISAITLSPKARVEAEKVLSTIPEDSNQFLAATAEHAAQIYPLARQVIGSNPEQAKRFRVVFLADSHLRHMMYAEGSQAMFSRIKQGLADESLSWNELDLWYAHWMINIAGFRGHIAPQGSLYLTLSTYHSMNMVWKTLLRMTSDKSVNPLQFYLEQRSRKLRLKDYLPDPEQQLAVALLSAQTRAYTSRRGRLLASSFLKLSADNQKCWIDHTQKQMKVLDEPAATYVPALFANMIQAEGLEKTIRIAVPVVLDTYEMAANMRSAGTLPETVPLCFRELAGKDAVQQLASEKEAIRLNIEPSTGVVRLVRADNI